MLLIVLSVVWLRHEPQSDSRSTASPSQRIQGSRLRPPLSVVRGLKFQPSLHNQPCRTTHALKLAARQRDSQGYPCPPEAVTARSRCLPSGTHPKHHRTGRHSPERHRSGWHPLSTATHGRTHPSATARGGTHPAPPLRAALTQAPPLGVAPTQHHHSGPHPPKRYRTGQHPTQAGRSPEGLPLTRHRTEMGILSRHQDAALEVGREQIGGCCTLAESLQSGSRQSGLPAMVAARGLEFGLPSRRPSLACLAPAFSTPRPSTPPALNCGRSRGTGFT